MNTRSVLFIVIFALILCLFLAVPTLGQDDVPPELVPPASLTETYDWAKEIGFASLFVTVLVSFAKYIPQLNSIPASRLSFALSLIIWVGLIMFRELGYEGSFVDTITNFGKLFQVFGNIITTFFGSAALYVAADATQVPVLSKKRS